MHTVWLNISLGWKSLTVVEHSRHGWVVLSQLNTVCIYPDDIAARTMASTDAWPKTSGRSDSYEALHWLHRYIPYRGYELSRNLPSVNVHLSRCYVLHTVRTTGRYRWSFDSEFIPLLDASANLGNFARHQKITSAWSTVHYIKSISGPCTVCTLPVKCPAKSSAERLHFYMVGYPLGERLAPCGTDDMRVFMLIQEFSLHFWEWMTMICILSCCLNNEY